MGLLEIMNEVSKEKSGVNLIDSPEEMTYLLEQVDPFANN
jgi:hypothetical protein